MTFETYAYTNKGGRKNNQDYCVYNDYMWVLCDGLGGHEGGEIASKTGATAALMSLEENGLALDEQFLYGILSDANKSVIEKQSQNAKIESMRTTIVLAVTDGETVRYANVGDSRFYYFRNNAVMEYSQDHSVSALSVKLGDISFEDIRGDEDRNKLVKVLGNDNELNVKIPQERITAMTGDAFLLCSDGFWEYVHETEMEIDLAKSSSPREWLEYMTKRILLKTQNVNNDNFTAVGVMISE